MYYNNSDNSYMMMQPEVVDRVNTDSLRLRNYNLSSIISSILMDINCDCRLAGYSYIHTMIWFVIQGESYYTYDIDDMYPKLVKIYSRRARVTKDHIIKHIRYSIKDMWLHKTNDSLLSLLFGDTKLHPSNEVFLNAVIEYIRLLICTN